MTATDLGRCDYCQGDQPATGLYEPIPGLLRCKDAAGCAHRQMFAGTNTLPDFARPAETVVRGEASPGAACGVCGAPASAAALYERVPSSGTWVCRDRAACDLRAATDMTPIREDFTDYVITPAMIRASHAAAGAVVPDERLPPDPAAIAAAARSAEMRLAAAGTGASSVPQRGQADLTLNMRSHR